MAKPMNERPDRVAALVASSQDMLNQIKQTGMVTKQAAALLSIWDVVWEAMYDADQETIDLTSHMAAPE